MTEVRVAAVFDRVDESGRPWFSPNRWRVTDPEMRRALVHYLRRAPLVLRAQGYEPDPLDPGQRPAVPVGYRSDSAWVWQEAAPYYLDRYGVAPPDGLVEHIQRHGYTPPAELSNEAARAAEEAALSGTPTEAQPADCQYFANVTDRPPDRPSGVLRRYRNADGYLIDEALQRDLRWGWTNLFARNARSGEYDLAPISERRAAEIADRRWRELTATPGA